VSGVGTASVVPGGRASTEGVALDGAGPDGVEVDGTDGAGAGVDCGLAAGGPSVDGAGISVDGSAGLAGAAAASTDCGAAAVGSAAPTGAAIAAIAKQANEIRIRAISRVMYSPPGFQNRTHRCAAAANGLRGAPALLARNDSAERRAYPGSLRGIGTATIDIFVFFGRSGKFRSLNASVKVGSGSNR
jgi:hypothetical protein